MSTTAHTTLESLARLKPVFRDYLRKLGLSADIVNVKGGSIAHGHRIGAMGAVLRDDLKRDGVTQCIGGARAARSPSR